MNLPWMRSVRAIDAGGLACCLLIAAGGYLFAVRPYLDQSQRASRQSQALAEALVRAEVLERNLNHLRDGVAKASAELASQPLRLQDAGGLNRQLAALSAAAERCGVALHSLSPAAPEASGRLAAITIEVTGAGPYPKCHEFIRNLHDEFPHLHVSAFELSSQPAAAVADCTFRYTLRWHVNPASVASSQ